MRAEQREEIEREGKQNKKDVLRGDSLNSRLPGGAKDARENGVTKVSCWK